MRLQEYAVDGLIPSAVVWPETVEQVAAVLQWAQREKLAVIPCGSGTKSGWEVFRSVSISCCRSPPGPGQRLRRGQLYDHRGGGDDVRGAHSTDRSAYADAATAIPLRASLPWAASSLPTPIAPNAYAMGAYGTSFWACASPCRAGKSPTSAARWSKMWRATICVNSFLDRLERLESLSRPRSIVRLARA